MRIIKRFQDVFIRSSNVTNHKKPSLIKENSVSNYANIETYSEEGGMAIIHKAFNIISKRWCILKVLRQEYIGDKDAVSKFNKEAEILINIKKLDKTIPIPEVYNFGNIRDKFARFPYIEIEYIPGRLNLNDYIKEHGNLSIRQADEIIVKLLPALKAAHKYNYIHRDIKPSNILLRNKQLSDPVLIDFGIAKKEGSKKTQSGTFFSPLYMAPEQLGALNEEQTTKIDVYSLGILYFEMLSGKVPFFSDNPIQIAEMHREVPIEPIVKKSIPPERWDILCKLLSKKAKERPEIDEVAKYFNTTIVFSEADNGNRISKDISYQSPDLRFLKFAITGIAAVIVVFILYLSIAENNSNANTSKINFIEISKDWKKDIDESWTISSIEFNNFKKYDERYKYAQNSFLNIEEFEKFMEKLNNVLRAGKLFAKRENLDFCFIIDPNAFRFDPKQGLYVGEKVLKVNFNSVQNDSLVKIYMNYRIHPYNKDYIYVYKK